MMPRNISTVKPIRIFLGICLTLVLPDASVAQAVPPALPGTAASAEQWPAEVAATIRELLDTKAEAMAGQGGSMRSPGGKLGLQFGQLMDKLAAQSDADELAEKATKLEGEDITAKLIVLARDRRARSDLYKRIAADYVDWPKDPYAYYHAPVGILPHIQAPMTVASQDLDEAAMPPIEYSYFAPPCGRGFAMDIFRGNLFDALMSKKDQASLRVLLAVDLLIGAGHIAPRAPDRVTLRNQCEPSDLYFAAHPDEFSFKVLARAIFNNSFVLGNVKQSMTNFAWTTENVCWRQLPEDQRQAAADKNRAAWMRLAEQEWKQPHEKEFAAFLKTIPKPAPKEKPKAVPKGPADPSDPFSPAGP